MLLLYQIIQKCRFSPNGEFILDRLGLLRSLQHLLICSLANHPEYALQSRSKGLQFLLGNLFLTHLNYYKSMSAPPVTGEPLVLDAIALLNEELKEKNLKRQAVEQVGTIALVLSVKRIRQELVPLLVKTFVQENLEMRVVIIRSFSSLLEFLRPANQSFVLLEFVIDVLCSFSEEELRKETYIVLEKIMEGLDLRAYQGEIIKAIRELSKESQRNIKEVVLRLVRHLYIVTEGENEQYLQEIIGQYRSEEEQVILAQELAEFIKIMPPFPQTRIHSLLRNLLASPSGKVRSKLVEPVILLAKALDEETTQEYFEALLGDTSPDVLAALVLQVRGIAQLPSKKVLGQVLQLIDTPQRHDSTVRAAILQVLQYIPLTPSRRSYILSSNHFKSLSLSKALADSLCKIHDIQALGLLIETSDTEFKNKLFPKLPSACEIHVKLMEHIFAQKNWRSKLTLLQNIEKRMENDENVEIFIPKLLEQIGDKIGILRASVVRLLALIVRARRIQLKDLARPLSNSANSKNWFQRQSVLVFMQHLAPHYPQLSSSDRIVFKSHIALGLSSSVHNIRSLAESIKSQCKLPD